MRSVSRLFPSLLAALAACSDGARSGEPRDVGGSVVHDGGADPSDASAPDAFDGSRDGALDATSVEDAGPSVIPCVAPADEEACNGSRALCDRTYDAVSYATTHNAMSNADEGWSLPNQQHGIRRQLDDGIRGLMLDVHEGRRGPLLCHGLCAAGQKPLVDGLREIRAFLECRPRDVVTIVFESSVPASDVARAFGESGLDRFVHTQALGAPWPTLGAMASAGRTLVVFTDADPGTPAWYHDAWRYTWQNPYAAETADDFDCRPDRGDSDAGIFVMNHFLTAPFASRELAEQVNHNPLLRDRVFGCRDETGARPVLVTIDFYDIGDVLEVVEELNQE